MSGIWTSNRLRLSQGCFWGDMSYVPISAPNHLMLFIMVMVWRLMSNKAPLALRLSQGCFWGDMSYVPISAPNHLMLFIMVMVWRLMSNKAPLAFMTFGCKDLATLRRRITANPMLNLNATTRVPLGRWSREPNYYMMTHGYPCAVSCLHGRCSRAQSTKWSWPLKAAPLQLSGAWINTSTPKERDLQCKHPELLGEIRHIPKFWTTDFWFFTLLISFGNI